MIISFSGLDGSGKTTHADLLESRLKGMDLECRRRHAIKGSLAYFLTHSVVGRVSPEAKKSVESGLREKGGPKSSALSFAKKTFLLLDLLYFNLRYGAYKKSREKNIISDRYFYDEMVQMKYLGLAGRRYLDFYRSLVIPPDAAFYLREEPLEAFTRKGEYDEGYYNSKSVLYDGLKSEIASIIEVPAGTIERRQGMIDGHIDGYIKEEKAAKPRRFWNAGKLQAAALIVITIAFVYFIKSNMEYLSKISVFTPALLALVVLLNLVNRTLSGLKIKTITALSGKKLSFTEWFGLAAITNFYNYLFTKAGTTMAAVYLKKHHKLDFAKCTGLFAGDAVVAFLASGMLGAAASFYGYASRFFTSFFLVLLFLFIALATLTLIFLPDIKFADKGFLGQVNRVLHGWNLLRKDRKTMVKLLFLNMGVIAVFAVRYYIIFRVFSGVVPFFVCLMISPFTVITQVVSIIPGAYGLREVVTGIMTKLSNVGFVPGAIATLVDRVIMMCVAFITGSVFSYILLRKELGVDKEAVK